MLSRVTFGPTAAERVQVAATGFSAWIEEQLAPDLIDDSFVSRQLWPFDTLHMDHSVIFDVSEDSVQRELQQAALVRAVYSRRQLYEIMVDFWSDHFNISQLKGDCLWLKTIDDREVIRPHALGSFRDLLWASLRSPAMLIYLDNQENRVGRPNENYARELLELHTLGVDAGYTQRDVEEVARCLTGWSVDLEARRGQWRFFPEQHDDLAKQVFGYPIPVGGGEADMERVFEAILAHPALPRFIARKLVRRLVADDPPMALVEAAATTFTATRGDLQAVLRTILLSPMLAIAPPKFKRPLPYIAGALRQLHATTDGGPPLLNTLAAMGQPLFQWHTPDGFPDTTAAWSGSLLARWQFALQLVANELPGTQLDLEALRTTSGATTISEWLDQLGLLLYGQALLPATRDRLVALLGPTWNEAKAQLALAILLAAPVYQWR
jgi:uncharacterized protein (DUF1800 family)